MGKIKIDIPKDMEAAFEDAFPGEDEAAAVLSLIEAEIARRQEVLCLRQEPPHFTDAEIRRAHEGRRGLVERLRRIRARSRPVTDDEIRQAREELRK